MVLSVEDASIGDIMYVIAACVCILHGLVVRVFTWVNPVASVQPYCI